MTGGHQRLVPLGEGTDHAAYLLEGRFVVRIARDGAAEGVERDARVLEAVGRISPFRVPDPVLVAPRDGVLVYAHLDGTCLLDVAPAARAPHAPAIGAALGRLLAALHATPPDALAGIVAVDAAPPEAWRADATADAVPPAYRSRVAAFLAEAPPDAAPTLRFTHNDLGAEHVLVDPRTWAVTGILDWSDAAVGDPARDFGLLLRDLGPAGLDAALRAYGPEPPGLRERARFHARCALLEDLAYGVGTDSPRYVDNALAALPALFPGT